MQAQVASDSPRQFPTNTERPNRGDANKIQGCDYHPAFQQIAFVDTETGELQERRLQHREEAEKFYRDLAAQGMKVGVGMEASGHARWFERLLSELQFELWIGDAAKIRTKRVRKQKIDRQDAQLILRLMLEDRLPQRDQPELVIQSIKDRFQESATLAVTNSREGQSTIPRSIRLSG